MTTLNLMPYGGRMDDSGPSTTPGSLRSICVYCASSPGSNPEITAATIALGSLLAAEGIELVYGGGAVGLMGLVADTVLDAGGRVTGVMPTGLFPREVGHPSLTEMIEVESMHQRKLMMFERSDAFIALPGGLGTLEEVSEIATWAQIGIHTKPIGVLNVDGYYDAVFEWLDRAISDRLLKPTNREILIDRTDPHELLEALRSANPQVESKWLDLDQT